MFKCPYCSKPFKFWISVRGHTSSCATNTKEYYIDKLYGPLHYTIFDSKTDREIRSVYPKLNSLSDIRRTFRNKNIVVNILEGAIISKQDIIVAIQDYYFIHGRIPQIRDFYHSKYPGITTIRDRFGSWNEAIKAAGFEPNENDGFGTRTIADDGVLYRSHYETMFVNRFLFNKEIYEYEVKYPNHNKYYDFYLPERDIYIEIDGGCRPVVMEEKLKINKELGRNLLVIKGNEIATFSGF